jgi:uncharacterized protein YukE
MTMVIGFLTLWVKLRYSEKKAQVVEAKIDTNTQITREGAKEAAATAKEVAKTASAANLAVENINKKLNGGLDNALEGAIKPLRDAFQDHYLQDEANMKEIRSALANLHQKIDRVRS